MKDKAIWIIIAIITLLIIALVLIAIIFIVRDANKNNKNCKNGNVNYLMIENSSCGDCSGSLDYACVSPPVYELNCNNDSCAPCPPSPLCFTKVQTVSASGVTGNNANFGESLAVSSEWLMVGQTTGTVSNIFIFGKDSTTGTYVYNSTLTFAGTSPKISLSDTYMSVSTNSSGVGILYENSYSSSTWNLVSTTSLTDAIASLSQYGSSVAVVSGFNVYIYSGGILNAQLGGLNAVSVAISGDINKNYLIVGSLGAAYAFSKTLTETSWGEVKRSYVGDNIGFGANVSFDAPRYSISDYQNDQLLIYNICNVESPIAVINAIGNPTSKIFTPGVLVTGYSSLTLYTSQNSMFDPPCFFPGYEWDYDDGGPIVSNTNGLYMAVKYGSLLGVPAIDIFYKTG